MAAQRYLNQYVVFTFYKLIQLNWIEILLKIKYFQLQHVVMTSKMNDKTIMQRDMNADPHFGDLKTF